MKIKTSNTLLLGYLGLLLLLIATTIIFGFSHKEKLSYETRYPVATIDTKSMESFRVLHITGDAKVKLATGTSHAIDFLIYPNETNTPELSYRVANDTCFIDVWARKGLAEAVLKTPQLDAILVMHGAELLMSEFRQEQLTLRMHAARVKITSMGSEIKALNLVAEDESKAELYGVDQLHIDLKASQVQLNDYAAEISGILGNNSRLELRNSAGKLNLEKSKNSKIFIR
ncbi:MAG: hypothetical protein JJU28_15265 [Cyclobacteriaceae bacterium]|nr:hypothetical protein [Cyclobacteriaceae bacterium]